MARRVILYLENVKILQDEEELREMSLKCEPVPSNTGRYPLQLMKGHVISACMSVNICIVYIIETILTIS